MEIEQKPVCKFGNRCYRKNPDHLKSYSHPEKRDDSKRSNNAQNSKKPTASKRKRKHNTSDKKKDKEVKNKRVRSSCFAGNEVSDNSTDNEEELSNEADSVQSTSWVFIKNDSGEDKTASSLPELNDKTVEEKIKILFLVDMPPDFYSFYEFCKTIDVNFNYKEFTLGDLKLVGPFDILSGSINYPSDIELFLCHWRFFYDPPEFQTVLAAPSGFHIGYWRDDPNESPVFLASNNPNKDCIFKTYGENIFGAVFNYLGEFIKTCDPFKKTKIAKLRKSLEQWVEKNNFTLEQKTSKINVRQKKVVSKTFHGAGIVVPVDPKTELGYRPLIETEANIKKICNLIMKASDESERESLWDNLQPLINAANIANDECDFGNSLELGIDLFCMGSPLFHDTVEHLLSTAYTLLNRDAFEKIIKAHLKLRRKSSSLSIDS